jgi:hypothetical protein
MESITYRDVKKQFPDDDTCLEWIFNQRYPKPIICENCRRKAKYYRIKNRKIFSCEWCGHQISPTKNTIFEKSRVPLTTWFFVIYILLITNYEVSVTEIKKQTGVSYNTAWRMKKIICDKLMPKSSMDNKGKSYEEFRKFSIRN